MKKQFLIWTLTMGLGTATGLSLRAEPQVTPVAAQINSSQPTPGSLPWYKKAATSIGPADLTSQEGLVLQAGSLLYLEGNSIFHNYQSNADSPHKFHMNANVLLGSAKLKDPKENLAQALKNNGVDSLALVIPVEKLNSKKPAMDGNAYKALRSKENPSIEFTLESEVLRENIMTANGNLKVAGITIPLTLSPEVEIQGNRVHLKGIQKLKMSDFGVKLPTLSIPTTSITCADEIEIHYDLFFAPPEP